MKLPFRYSIAVLALVVGLAAIPSAPASPPDHRFAVTYAHVVDGKRGPYLVVRVKGPAKTVRIAVSLLSGKRVLRVARRTVRTNHRVRVPRLSIPTTVTSVRIRILGHVA
jgi:hypothetical protein